MRCRDCGFAYTLTLDEVADRVGLGLQSVHDAVDGVPQEARTRRPAPEVWSGNAYPAHLSDAAKVIYGRTVAIAEQNRPLLAWHDQDQAVEEGRSDERLSSDSLTELAGTVSAFQRYVRAPSKEAWHRVGVHAKAGEVLMSDIAHDLPHELEHHAADIRRVGAQVEAAIAEI